MCSPGGTTTLSARRSLPRRLLEDRRREQLERKTQGRHVQPVVLAEELSERRRRTHATGMVSDMEAASESGVGIPFQGSPKRRRTELLLGGARDRPVKKAVAPEPITSTTPRGKRKKAHTVWITVRNTFFRALEMSKYIKISN